MVTFPPVTRTPRVRFPVPELFLFTRPPQKIIPARTPNPVTATSPIFSLPDSLVGQDRWFSPTRPGFDSRSGKFCFAGRSALVKYLSWGKSWSIWVSIPVPRPCEGRALPIAPIPRNVGHLWVCLSRSPGSGTCWWSLILQSSASRLAQLVERKTLNLVVVGSSPTVGAFLVRPDFLAYEGEALSPWPRRCRSYQLRWRSWQRVGLIILRSRVRSSSGAYLFFFHSPKHFYFLFVKYGPCVELGRYSTASCAVGWMAERSKAPV